MKPKAVINTLTAATLVALSGSPAYAASHREAPLTALDEKADITDFYAFVSYDDPTKVTLIMGVDPLLEPGNGPNYFPFDPEIRYAIRIDNDKDAVEDVSFEVEFETEIRAPNVFTGFVGAGGGIPAPANSPAPIPPGTTIVPPAITALDGPGAAGLSLRQMYTVTMVEGTGSGATRTELASGLIAVPSNVGPRTMPDYESLAAQGVHDLGGGVRVFAGAVDDPFYIDLGAAFDTFNFRASVVGPGIVPAAFDAMDDINYAPDDVSGYNVNVIAIEVPITLLTSDGALHTAGEPEAVIGTWATTARPRVKAYSTRPDRAPLTSGSFVQIQRMANPLINELIIGTGDKDLWSRSEPADDAQFAAYDLDPLLARVFNAATGGALAIPTPPRTDLLPLVQYMAPMCPGCDADDAGPIADLLRLNTAIPPTPAASRSRLGFIAGDTAGFPNGRRVSDDVTDIATRVVVGGVLAAPFPGYDPEVNGRLGDGVNTNDMAYQETFPYVGYAQSGRNSRHVDPNEMGCSGSCPEN